MRQHFRSSIINLDVLMLQHVPSWSGMSALNLGERQGIALIVEPPKRPLDPLASSFPSAERAIHMGHVVSSCRPCSDRRHSQRVVSHT